MYNIYCNGSIDVNFHLKFKKAIKLYIGAWCLVSYIGLL